MESLADPSKWAGLDERDPKSIAKWAKRMEKELGEDMNGEVVEMVDKAFEEEMASKSNGDLEN
jgi:hypothetical protein